VLYAVFFSGGLGDGGCVSWGGFEGLLIMCLSGGWGGLCCVLFLIVCAGDGMDGGGRVLGVLP